MSHPIVIHAGFHKTGTSTIQRFLKTNRAALKPHAVVVLKGRMEGLISAARGYSTWRDPLTLAKFATRADDLVQSLAHVKRRALILSAEELSGHMPGREGIDDYAAAADLMAELADAFRRHRDAPDLRLVYGVRDGGAWLASSYWEHVKSSSMTEDMDAYAARIGPIDLSATAQSIARQTGLPLTLIALTDPHPLGPAGALLDAAGLPTGALMPEPPRNTRPRSAGANAAYQPQRTRPHPPPRLETGAIAQPAPFQRAGTGLNPLHE